MKKIGLRKRILFVMAAAAFLLTSVNFGSREVYGDEGFQIALSQMTPEKPNSGDTIQFSKAEISTGSYTDKKVTCLIVTVNVGSIITTSDSIPDSYLVGGGIMTDDLADHQTVTCFWNEGKEVEEIATLLQTIKYIYNPGMKITITVDTNYTNLPTGNNKITTLVLAHPITERQSGDSMHYYMYVPTYTGGSSYDYSKTTPWDQSYDLAKSYYFMGMRGYLATITERAEDEILDTTITFFRYAFANERHTS